MRRKDIESILASNPRTLFAVRRAGYVQAATINRVGHRHAVLDGDLGPVRLGNVLSTWEAHAGALQHSLPAFEGIHVGGANLADTLRETFITQAADTMTVEWETFAAIADRIEALQGDLARAGAAWGAGDVRDTGIPVIEHLPPSPSVIDERLRNLDRLLSDINDREDV